MGLYYLKMTSEHLIVKVKNWSCLTKIADIFIYEYFIFKISRLRDI
jgi:hypothetical protein